MPVQDGPLVTPVCTDNRPSKTLGKKSSNQKRGRPYKTKNNYNIVGKKKPLSKAQRQQAISRRKLQLTSLGSDSDDDGLLPPLFHCPVPGCDVDSTTNFRIQSKFVIPFPLSFFHSLFSKPSNLLFGSPY